MCFVCSKEPSHRDGSFEYPQHMYWLRNKKINFSFKKGNIWRHFSAAILREYFASRIFTILKYFNSKYALCVPTDMDPNKTATTHSSMIKSSLQCIQEFAADVKSRQHFQDKKYLWAVCLFHLILYVQSTIFQLKRDGCSCVETVLS